jgi:glycine betaine/proline transport system substrate-binding protein
LPNGNTESLIDSSINKKRPRPWGATGEPDETTSAIAMVAAFVATQARADCETITFSEVGWTDITATTAVATTILEALGQETETLLLSVPVTYSSMAEGDVDVFLGNWMPTMEADIAPYREPGTVDTVRTNLDGAKYTLGTNAAGAALGIDSFDDIAAQAEALTARSTASSPATTATA